MGYGFKALASSQRALPSSALAQRATRCPSDMNQRSGAAAVMRRVQRRPPRARRSQKPTAYGRALRGDPPPARRRGGAKARASGNSRSKGTAPPFGLRHTAASADDPSHGGFSQLSYGARLALPISAWAQTAAVVGTRRCRLQTLPLVLLRDAWRPLTRALHDYVSLGPLHCQVCDGVWGCAAVV